MAKKILIQAGTVKAEAVLNETRTARLIWNALPLTARANMWGEEVYFEIPVRADLEDPADVVSSGDLGYWPRGAAFCIFFGPTPISRGDEIRPASPVNLVGRVQGDPKMFRAVTNEDTVCLSRKD